MCLIYYLVNMEQCLLESSGHPRFVCLVRNSGKEAKGLSSLPPATRLVSSKVPGPDAATWQVADLMSLQGIWFTFRVRNNNSDGT
jgi:hypothetical protein